MLARRLRAFELYSSGIKPSEIGRELGVTRQTVSYWARADKWDARLSDVIHRAEQSLAHVLGDQVAHILTSLRARMGARVAELEGLCASRNEHVRLKAITAWLKLAGVDQAVPTPTDPAGPHNLELIQDLLPKPEIHDAPLPASVVAEMRGFLPADPRAPARTDHDAALDRKADRAVELYPDGEWADPRPGTLDYEEGGGG